MLLVYIGAGGPATGGGDAGSRGRLRGLQQLAKGLTGRRARGKESADRTLVDPAADPARPSPGVQQVAKVDHAAPQRKVQGPPLPRLRDEPGRETEANPSLGD